MRTVILFLALVVVAAGCMDNNQQNMPTPDNTDQTSAPQNPETGSSNSNIIYLTDSGFTPADVTIQQGETVTWINNASTAMWVASDRHPSHTNYAGSNRQEHCQNGDQTTAAFDQCSTGNRFSFTFEKTGEWSYHNHRNVGQTGTITVE